MRRTHLAALGIAVAAVLIIALALPRTLPATAQDSATPPAVGSWVDTVVGIRSAVVTVVNEQQTQGFGNQGSQEAGRGPGFAIDETGHIVTNWHVVRGGDSFQVILADGSKRPATLVGSDRLSDLAVIKVDGTAPPAMRWGDSDALQPGEPVLAMGSPLGAFTNTVTDGIVSGTGRDFPGSPGEPSPAYNNLVQHNAAINPGNSGGPLVIQSGVVVGINTLGISQVPGSNQPAQGLFFAIPTNAAKAIVNQLIENGRVAYPFLGASAQPVTRNLASQYDLPVDHGVFVQRVSPAGPAAQAGIRQGDFIVAIDGQQINENNSFSEALFNHAPGEEITVTIHRNGDEQELQVTLGERPRE